MSDKDDILKAIEKLTDEVKGYRIDVESFYTTFGRYIVQINFNAQNLEKRVSKLE